MRFLYALAAFAVLSTSAFAQAAADQVDPELVVAGSAAISTVINNTLGPNDLPGIYFPQDTSYTVAPFSIYIGASVFTANNDGATGIGVVYSRPGVTAPAVVARRADASEAIGCTANGTGDTPPPSDIANSAEFAGKVVMIRRGVCSFVYKVLAAQSAGAVGVVIYNGSDRKGTTDALTGGMAAPAGFTTQFTIPAVIIPNGLGQPIVDEIGGGGTVSLTIRAFDATVAAEPTAGTTISGLEIRGANPFAVSTTLRVYTEQAEAVRVDVFNVRGQQVATLFDGAVAGERTVTLSSATLAPGVYFVRATGETFRSQQQVTVVR